MVGKEISVKKYVVRLSADEREQLEVLIRKGKSPAQRLLKARILLKADVSQAGDGWSDSRIIKALETSPSMIYRVRKQLVEEGFEAVLSRKQRATPAVAPIFDGEKEAKLIALACSKPPQGRARWTLRLLERKVVELKIVERASDLTIGRVLTTYGPPRLQGVLSRSAADQSASTYPASRNSLRPRWRYARSGPHKSLGVERRFLNQASGAPFDCQIPWGLGLWPKLGQSAVTSQSPVGGDHAEQSVQCRNRNLYPHRSSRDFRFLGIKPNDMAGHLAVPGHAGEDVKALRASR